MKKKRKAWIWILVVVLILALGGGAAYWYFFRMPDSAGTAYVQSVATIAGLGNVGSAALYSGIVEAKDVIKIDPQSDLRIAECFVESGSKVKTGDPLFRYDVDDLKLSHAQLLIDITGLENQLRTDSEELESLNKRLERAKESAQYEIKLQIQTIELEIRKTEYDLKDKQASAESLQTLIDASVVTSPVDGTVRSVRSDSSDNPYGYLGGEETSYITIVAGTDYCVKGTVNEQTVYTLFAGMEVLIRSRVDDTVKTGTIYKINTDATEDSQRAYYYDGSGEQTSKYAFYVEPENIDGLLIGQHVLIDLNTASVEDDGLWLPAAYLLQENDRFFAWAANADNRIEKREVQVGAYNEETECYEILGGLKPKDRIAYPDDTVHAGMLATETAYTDPDALPVSPGMLPDYEPEYGFDDNVITDDSFFGIDDSLDISDDVMIDGVPLNGIFDDATVDAPIEPEPAQP